MQVRLTIHYQVPDEDYARRVAAKAIDAVQANARDTEGEIEVLRPAPWESIGHAHDSDELGRRLVETAPAVVPERLVCGECFQSIDSKSWVTTTTASGKVRHFHVEHSPTSIELELPWNRDVDTAAEDFEADASADYESPRSDVFDAVTPEP